MLIFRKKIFNYKKEVVLFLVVLIILFIFLEIGSWIYVCKFASSEFQANVLFYGEYKFCGLVPRYSPHPYLNYQGTPNFQTSDGEDMHNSLGFRGPEIEVPKPDGVYRIALLGGSTTYTSGVDSWKKDFARQLEKNLNEKYNTTKIEVINAGIPGYNSWESLINFQFKVLDLDPDLIIVYHGTNDVHTRLVDPISYRRDDSGKRKQWENPEVPLFLRPIFVRFFTGSRTGLGSFVDAETSFYGNTEENAFEALAENPPIYFEENLKDIVSIAKSNGVEVLLSTWAHTNKFGDYASKNYYEQGFLENNNVVRGVANSTGVFLYDFVLDMPMDKEYWKDGRHVNEAGSELKGELFADYLFNNKVLDEKIFK